ncbi:growth arrest and DNA damage-inducible protein GADD45 gamma [Aquila chrysaetos chrysaetos]|uniref:Growth arrest and DNA damage-inducible protein GADD45 gamma n=2 Tax=Accipitrinae TaxID=8955 RepID=A0A663EWN4_AQUCH|nr:growth arrest and DNA damage-inducible protein GADD45 gamma [Aquila chrysaetos chrysaetos]
MGRPAGLCLRLLGERAARRRWEPSLAAALWGPAAMTLEEIHGQEPVPAGHDWMQGAGKALHELLVSAQRRGCLTAGVYESAKLMNVDPDNVTFCVLATDEEDEGDIALQIHFTLIQAFCCENDIDIVRVNDVAKLAAIVGPSEESGEPRDLHCILITNPNENGWKDPALEKLNSFCEESRNVNNDWVPTITLPE